METKAHDFTIKADTSPLLEAHGVTFQVSIRNFNHRPHEQK